MSLSFDKAQELLGEDYAVADDSFPCIFLEEFRKQKEQLDFAIDHLRGVCAACKHYGISEEEEPCATCGETPGYGNWLWKFD